MKKNPIYLDLRNIKFTINAIISILHRISGFIIFISTSIILYVLKLSLSSPKNFTIIKMLLNKPITKYIFLSVLITLIYHILSGMRHILMDFGFIKETLKIGKITAIIVFILTIIISICIFIKKYYI